LDRTNKKSFIVVGFSPKRFLVSVFLASEKFDSDLELDAGMHPCPPKSHGHGWAWAPSVGLCWGYVHIVILYVKRILEVYKSNFAPRKDCCHMCIVGLQRKKRRSQ